MLFYRITFHFVLASAVTIAARAVEIEEGTGNMVKMCLFYPSESGHARTDPILDETGASDHVHTFYGPQNFHPNTTYEQIRDTSPEFSTAEFIENQSLYWHPSIYMVPRDENNEKLYTRVNNLDSSPYYRWDNSVKPKTEAFPPKFRMIAFSDQKRAGTGGETGGNLFMECCQLDDGEEDCTNFIGNADFPEKNCDFLGIAFAMPTCWNGDLGIENDHINHMAYTLDGTVAGQCPPSHQRRLPQIQLFIRIANYQGKKFRYVLSNDSKVFHVDFFNGWREGVLDKIIQNCPIEDQGTKTYNPPCNCEQFLTKNKVAPGRVCDDNVRRYILDEPTDVVKILPRGFNQDTALIPKSSKSWDVDPPFDCFIEPPERFDSEEDAEERTGSGEDSGEESDEESGEESDEESGEESTENSQEGSDEDVPSFSRCAAMVIEECGLGAGKQSCWRDMIRDDCNEPDRQYRRKVLNNLKKRNRRNRLKKQRLNKLKKQRDHNSWRRLD